MRALTAHLRRLLVPAADDRLVAAAPAVALRVIFRRFWPLTRPYRGRIAAGLLLLALVPAVEAAQIWLFKVVVDDVLIPRDLAALAPLAAAYVGLAVALAVVSFGDSYLAAWVGERFLLDLRLRVFEHLQALAPDQLDRRRLGDVLSRLGSDAQAIERFVLSGLGDAISAGLRIVFFGAALALLSWKLALASIVVAPLFYVAARRFAGLVKHAAREKRRRSGALGAVAEEALANTALVQSLGREPAERERYRRESVAIMEAELASVRIRGLFGPIVDLIELLGALSVIALGVWALSSGDLTLGALLAFLAYLTQLYGPIQQLSRLSNSLFAASAGAERIIELLDERPRVRDGETARTLDAVSGAVELRDVSYRYPGAARDALHGVDLTIAAGETVALVGPSGAGKSTLARLLMRFADPSSGAVLLDGHDVRDVRLASLREHVGLLLQETLLPDCTVREAIGHGRDGATDAEVEAAARRAGADRFIRALPHGYDERIGQRGRRLSGGQRQRIGIARTLVRDTPVLVLDEPTTGLDGAARDRVLGPLTTLMEGRTTIIVSHDPAVVARADRVIRLEHGRVVADEPALPTEAAA
jgi:ABC-type multidrug transport system fused ATPase/permease subunit